MGSALMRSCNRFSRVSAFVSEAVAASPVTSPVFFAEVQKIWTSSFSDAPFNNFDKQTGRNYYEGRCQRPLRFPASLLRKLAHQSMGGLSAYQDESVKPDERRPRLDRNENQAKPRPLSAEPQ